MEPQRGGLTRRRPVQSREQGGSGLAETGKEQAHENCWTLRGRDRSLSSGPAGHRSGLDGIGQAGEKGNGPVGCSVDLAVRGRYVVQYLARGGRADRGAGKQRSVVSCSPATEEGKEQASGREKESSKRV